MPLHVRKSAGLVIILAAQLALAAPAQASGLLLVNTSMLALFQSATNQCFIYSYDHNGNRLARSNMTYGSTGAWGSSTYGCFGWSS